MFASADTRLMNFKKLIRIWCHPERRVPCRGGTQGSQAEMLNAVKHDSSGVRINKKVELH